MKGNKIKKYGWFFLVGGFFFITSCRPEALEVDFSIILESYKLSINEPSGLSYSADKESLYIVSDRGMIYEISLTGNIIKEFSFTGDDFEGVTVDPLTSDIYVCEEGKGKIIKLDKNGTYQSSYDILNNPGNTGLEGLAYNTELDEFYLLKEKKQGLLIKYSIENDLKLLINLNFSTDYSGIFYNNASNKIWIVSEESRTLTQCTLNGVKIKSYDLPISGVEGIVVNDEETIAYVVSDPNNKLYQLDLTIN